MREVVPGLAAPPPSSASRQGPDPEPARIQQGALQDPHTRGERHPEDQDIPDHEGPVQEPAGQVRPHQRHRLRGGQPDHPDEESRDPLSGGRGGPTAGGDRVISNYRSRLGDGFMPQVRRNRLVKMSKREKEGVEKFRLLAARMRKEGKSIREIAYELCKPYSTVRDWLLRMHAYGRRAGSTGSAGAEGGCWETQTSEAERWLDDTPEKHGFKSLSWQFDMILKLIKRGSGWPAAGRTLQRVLRKIHFSYRKPQERSAQFGLGRGAGEVQERDLRLDRGAAQGRIRRSNGDEGTVQRSPSNGYGWRRTGGHDTVPTSFSKESVKVFCVVGEGRLHVWTADATNSKTFVTMLRRLHRKYPKFVMVLTTHHTTNRPPARSMSIHQKESQEGDGSNISLPTPRS